MVSTAQTELIENQLNQLIMSILKSVHTMSATGMFSLMECNHISLITTVFSVTEGNDLYLNTAVFRKTDNEYPVIAHPALVLKRDFERNKKLQDDRLCELTHREVWSIFVLEFLLREHVSVCVIFFWIELSLFCEHSVLAFQHNIHPHLGTTCCSRAPACVHSCLFLFPVLSSSSNM